MNKKYRKFFIILGVIILVLFIILILNRVFNKEGKLIELDYNEVMTKMNNKDSFVLCLSQTTCNHCADYKPKLMSVARKLNINLYYIEVDLLNKEEQEEFSSVISYKGTPTTIFLKNGEETTSSNRLSGNVSEDKIISKLKSNGYVN